MTITIGTGRCDACGKPQSEHTGDEWLDHQHGQSFNDHGRDPLPNFLNMQEQLDRIEAKLDALLWATPEASNAYIATVREMTDDELRSAIDSIHDHQPEQRVRPTASDTAWAMERLRKLKEDWHPIDDAINAAIAESILSEPT